MNNNNRKIKLDKVSIVDRKDHTSDLWSLFLEKPNNFTFKPGQYCTIGVDGIERAYSIVSAPHEDKIELFIELVPFPDGILTPKLYDLNVGDQVTIRPRAKGLFTFKEEFTNHLLIATVTGIVPYISYIRDYIYRSCLGNKFFILLGASYIDEFVYDSELIDLSTSYSDFIKFIPTISRPNEPENIKWSGEIGRVNQIVEKYVNLYDISSDDTLVSACGHPGMIENVKEILGDKGFSIEEERYWKED